MWYNGPMKTIPLTRGRVALVSDEDYTKLSAHSWHFDGRYASGYMDGRKVRMHRVIANTPNSMQTDHINGDKLDNRRDNLVVCTRSENIHNKPASRINTSGYRGVCWDKERGRWMAYVSFRGKRKTLGRFTDIMEAAKAYNDALDRYFPESRWKNLI